MELASFLAGEPWSDHPACTHPLLAVLARDVNDQVGDRGRREIAVLVPDVIGLDVRDPAIDPLLAREVALTALPIASAERQRVLAVGLLRCERALDELDDRPAGRLSSRVESALEDVPHARDWAHAYCRRDLGTPDAFATRAAPAIVHSSVVGIAEAAVRNPDRVLVDLLRRSVADCATWMHHVPSTVAGEQWREVCQLTEPRRSRFLARR
jgi:hypothetical protein